MLNLLLRCPVIFGSNFKSIDQCLYLSISTFSEKAYASKGVNFPNSSFVDFFF